MCREPHHRTPAFTASHSHSRQKARRNHRLRFVKHEVGVEASAPVHKAITTANEKMGLEPEGSLPEQLDRLVQLFFS